MSQTEELPLIDYRDGAAWEGIRCRVWYEWQIGIYFAKINGLENIARELRLILPFVRTEKKLKQVARFREYLGQSRKRHQHQARRALEILDGAR